MFIQKVLLKKKNADVKKLTCGDIPAACMQKLSSADLLNVQPHLTLFWSFHNLCTGALFTQSSVWLACPFALSSLRMKASRLSVRRTCFRLWVKGVLVGH